MNVLSYRLPIILSAFWTLNSLAIDLTPIGIFNGANGEKIPLSAVVLVKDKNSGQIIPRDILLKKRGLVINQRFQTLILNGSVPTPPPPPELPPITQDNNEIGSPTKGPQSNSDSECENLANHHRDWQTKSEQHFYADGRLNFYVGTLTANVRPEYKVEGLTDWKPMKYLGQVNRSDGGGKFAWIYTEPSDGTPRLTYARTRKGCTEYPDNRTQVPKTNFSTDWSDIASVPALENRNDDLIIPIVESSDLEDATNRNHVSATYGTFLLHGPDVTIQSLNVTGNGSDIRDTNNYVPFKQDDVVLGTASTGFYLSTKDYILDVSTKKGNQRFIVHRNHQGGHFSVVTTITRHDGNVFVQPRHVTNFLPQKLVDENGKEFVSDSRWGRSFHLGELPDGEYRFKLYSQENVLIDPNIIVKVRKP